MVAVPLKSTMIGELIYWANTMTRYHYYGGINSDTKKRALARFFLAWDLCDTYPSRLGGIVIGDFLTPLPLL